MNEKEIVGFMNETSHLIQKTQLDKITEIVLAAKQAEVLSDDVEFWKWFMSSYPKFSDPKLLSLAAKNETNNITNFIQGKGFEWDFMQYERSQPKNITNKYFADTNATQPGYDIEAKNLITNQRTYYQNKAYTSNNKLQLKTTSSDITVVTNTERAGSVKDHNVIAFQNNRKIIKNTNKRLEQAARGTASASYGLANVAATMAQAGLIGAVIGITAESLGLYKLWKNGDITDRQYMLEITKAGGEGCLTSAFTAGIMIPITAFLTAAGLPGAPITIPIAFLVGYGVNKIIAPAFGRGDYLKILNEARYYKSLIDLNKNLVMSLDLTVFQFECFVKSAVYNTMEYHSYISNISSYKAKREEIDKNTEKNICESSELLEVLKRNIGCI